MKNHWLDKWENDKETCDELLFYQRQLNAAINETVEYENRLKILYYRIEKLREKISEISS